MIAAGCVVLAVPVGIAAADTVVNSGDLLAVALPLIFTAACWPLITKDQS